MKKKSIIIGIVLSVIVVGIALIRISASNVSASLTMEEAKSLAQAQFPGEVVEIEFEKMGSKAVYEVKIEGEGKSYELWLDGNTGEVLRLEEKASFSSNVDVEAEAEGSVSKSNGDKQKTNNGDESSSDDSANDDKSENTTKVEGEAEAEVKTEADGSKDSKKDDTSTGNQNDDSEAQDDQGNSGGLLNIEVPILKEAAIEIALNEINVNGTIKEIELDDDDGRLYYDIELYTDTHEIEMEIDAYTGEVLSISTEYED
jgi:uncharacterized membrane protein YkoI